MQAKTRITTKYYSEIIDQFSASRTYAYLRDNIKWEEGVRSKNGFTRLAKALDSGDNKVVDDILTQVLTKLGLQNQYQILGIYLNYYKDGTHYTPNHSHKGMTQLVVSLGTTRTLKVGSKDYRLNNGDAIIFGSSAHSIPQENTNEGRISIATFMQPVNTNQPLMEQTIIMSEEQLVELVKMLSLQ